MNVLTKNKKRKEGSDYSESDHNLINTKLKITWNANECKVMEVFRFKDEKSKEMFKKETSTTNDLSNLIEAKKPLHLVTKKVSKKIEGFYT